MDLHNDNDSDDAAALIEPLLIIGQGREERVILGRHADGRIFWRGDGTPSDDLIARIHAHQNALRELLGNTIITFEQVAYLNYAELDLGIDEAFGQAATGAGMTGGIEYGRSITCRAKPH
jgi:hypothetical protein